MCFRNIRWRVASSLLRYSHNSKLNTVAIASHQQNIGSDVLRVAAVEVILFPAVLAGAFSVPSRSHGVLVDILCCTSKHARARSLNRRRTRAATSEKEVAFGVNHVSYERLLRETKKRTATADQTPKMLPKSLRCNLLWAVKLISRPRKPSKNATTVRRYFQDDQMQPWRTPLIDAMCLWVWARLRKGSRRSPMNSAGINSSAKCISQRRCAVLNALPPVPTPAFFTVFLASSLCDTSVKVSLVTTPFRPSSSSVYRVGMMWL
ncbi:hypothetical protein KC330_g160 [Hortaea werneckii]|nr:hypothetical protein KC330_g160 [Hortaea werneckii]